MSQLSYVPRSFVMVSANDQLYPSVVTGFFAGSAWKESHQKFMDTLGESFGVITFDDHERYTESSRNIRKPKIQDWDNLPNEDKELCYKAYDSLKDVMYYTLEELGQ